MVPIRPQASVMDALTERDWPAVTIWTREKSDEMECRFVAATLLVSRFAAKYRSDQQWT